MRLRDTEVTYDDSSAGSHWRLQKVNATLGAIESGRRVPLDLQATIDNGTDKRSAVITIKASVQSSSDAQAFDMDALTIDAALTYRTCTTRRRMPRSTFPGLNWACEPCKYPDRSAAVS